VPDPVAVRTYQNQADGIQVRRWRWTNSVMVVVMVRNPATLMITPTVSRAWVVTKPVTSSAAPRRNSTPGMMIARRRSRSMLTLAANSGSSS